MKIEIEKISKIFWFKELVGYLVIFKDKSEKVVKPDELKELFGAKE